MTSPNTPSGVQIDTNALLEEVAQEHAREWLERLQLRVLARQQAEQIRYLESLQSAPTQEG